MRTVADVIGSYRLEASTGLATTIAADGVLLAFRNHNTSNVAVRLKSLEIEALTTTAFSAAQQVGYYAKIARGYTVAPSNGTAIAIGASGKKRNSYPSTLVSDLRVASTSAVTAGTIATLDANPVVAGAFWSSAAGVMLPWRRHDFSEGEPGGIILLSDEGFLIYNTVLMGTAGVVPWKFSLEWDDVLLGN